MWKKTDWTLTISEADRLAVSETQRDEQTSDQAEIAEGKHVNASENTDVHSVPQKKRSIIQLFGLILPIIVSLVSFPSVLPWMIAFWIGWSSYLAITGRPGWKPLVAVLVIALAKLVPALPMLIGLLTAIAGLAWFRRRQSLAPEHANSDQTSSNPTGRDPADLKLAAIKNWICYSGIWLLWLAMFVQWQAASQDSQRHFPAVQMATFFAAK